MVGKNGEGQAPKRKTKIPHFDNSALIADYSKTDTGRCFNPRIQDMKSLLHMMPHIWGMEGKVAGADLGWENCCLILIMKRISPLFSK